jgi:ParB family transcriptional regulator, chromosome partitioning protein
LSERGKGRRALGKGLGALIPGADAQRSGSGRREFFVCPVDRIHPREKQPRRTFDKAALEELVASIREQGVIQPLVVRRLGDGYELIAGERRWRAAQLAGLIDVPVVIKDVSDAEAFEMALVENLQREDLNPIEEAEAYTRLLDEHGYSQSELASRIGRDRSTVSNSLRLLKLPREARRLVAESRLSEGHARALLQAGSAGAINALARRAVEQGWSVREVERRARKSEKSRSSEKSKTSKGAGEVSPQVRALTAKLERALGARVRIADRKGEGRLEILYTSYEELDGILDKILR